GDLRRRRGARAVPTMLLVRRLLLEERGSLRGVLPVPARRLVIRVILEDRGILRVVLAVPASRLVVRVGRLMTPVRSRPIRPAVSNSPIPRVTCSRQISTGWPRRASLVAAIPLRTIGSARTISR